MIDKSVQMGLHCVIGEAVTIGANTTLGNGVIVYEGAIIGADVRIDDYAIIGKPQMKAKNSAVTTDEKFPPPRIGDGCIIGTFAIVYRGAQLDNHVLLADNGAIREAVLVGENTIIGKGAYIENAVTIGANCKIQSYAYICAYSKIEDDCFIAPCVVTSNDNSLGKGADRFGKFKGVTLAQGARLGAGSVILPAKVVEKGAIIGAGAVVTKDVPSDMVYVGNPAKPLKPAW